MRLQPHAEARTRLRRSTTPSISRLTAQHQEIERLQEQAAAAGNVRAAWLCQFLWELFHGGFGSHSAGFSVINNGEF